ncbi:hypothetical protein JXI42_03465 [bacterium]|nr:hypothetical protein [bacterium]
MNSVNRPRQIFLYIGIISIYTLLASSLSGQNLIVRNVLEYRGASEGHTSFEDRLDLRSSWKDFTGGIRYEIFQPSRDVPYVSSAGINQYFFRFDSKFMDVWVGDYYLTVKNGILLDAYDKRELRLDHKLTGAKLDLKYHQFELGAFTGEADWEANDALLRGFSASAPITIGDVGVSYVKYHQQEGSKDTIEAFSYSFNTYYRNPNLWGEIAHIGPIFSHLTDFRGVYDEIDAIYLGTIVDLWGVILTLQYKDYDNLDDIPYNNPPTAINEPTYTILSRHIYEVDWDDEQGLHAELGYVFMDDLEMLTNYSHSQNHDGKALFDESHTEVLYNMPQWEFKLVGNYRKESSIKYLSGISEVVHYLNEANTITLDLEAQAETQPEADLFHFFSSVQFNHSPSLAIGVEGGQYDRQVEKDNFIRIFGSYLISEKHKVELSFGKIPEGFICSGGVCRFEPQFEGVELRISSTF